MINNNSMRQVVFSVPPVLYRLLKEEADRKAQTTSAMIRLILAERYSGESTTLRQPLDVAQDRAQDTAWQEGEKTR